jgi:hypothetical protein
MVGCTQINFVKYTDRTSTQAGLSVGSIVRGSVLIVTIETQAMSVRQRYRGARSTRVGTTGSIILTSTRVAAAGRVIGVDKRNAIWFTAALRQKGGITCLQIRRGIGCGTEKKCVTV